MGGEPPLENHLEFDRKCGHFQEQQNPLLPPPWLSVCNFIPVWREGLASASLFAASKMYP